MAAASAVSVMLCRWHGGWLESGIARHEEEHYGNAGVQCGNYVGVKETRMQELRRQKLSQKTFPFI